MAQNCDRSQRHVIVPESYGFGLFIECRVCGFLAVSEGNYFSATLEACVAYTIAGECAAQGLTTQVGQFQIRLLDELAALSPETIGQRGRINE